ncbi:MAG: zinc-dependent peptidase [Nitrococcus mobilis]|nr:zinc-dependent peptidase [Nitrococcus mobilis]
MTGWLRRWRRKRILAQKRIPERLWQEVIAAQPLLMQMSAPAQQRLHELATLLVAEKRFYGIAGLQMGPWQTTTIAALGCVPVLELGLDWYRGWYSIVVYPGGFRARHAYPDDAGVVHEQVAELIGEAWDDGPLVLSWDDIQGGAGLDGYNVILHEFAHKLDMRNGVANGMPPLHRGMSQRAWTRAFTDAWSQAQAAVAADEEPVLDRYALESPGEFFAVACEAFFELPERLCAGYPAVYEQLCRFFRQDPLQQRERCRATYPPNC